MKLHLGCGKRFIPGFVHIDAIDYPHVDQVSSIDRLDFAEDNSVDLIYNCHVLEHFKQRDVKRVLSEWKRVLRPGGILRTSVPDFESICEIYQKYKRLDLVLGPVFGRQDYLYNFHYTIFDYATLEKAFNEVGFCDVRRYDWRTTEHSAVDDYSQAYIPHMDKLNGIQVSLNIECTKPSE